jgi:hypothetical protein
MSALLATTDVIVYVVICVSDDGQETTHIFSTAEKAQAFIEQDERTHVVYDYVLDHPERHDAVMQ